MKKYFLLWFVFAAPFCNDTFAQIADTISASATNICAGSTVIIRATHLPHDTNPTFQFFVNHVSLQNATTDSFIYSMFNNGDSVKCFYRSHNLHSANDSAMSNTIHVAVAIPPVAKFGFTDSANVYKFTDSSTNAQNHYWIFGDGDTSSQINPTHIYSPIGIFMVQLMVSNFCKTDTSNAVTITISTGVNNLQNENAKLQVYPNPAHESLVVSHKSQVNTIQVYDVIGRKISTNWIPLTTYDLRLDTNNLPSGIYFIKATNMAGNSYTAKFVKE